MCIVFSLNVIVRKLFISADANAPQQMELTV